MKKLLLNSNSTQHGFEYLEHIGSEIKDFFGDSIKKVLFIPYAGILDLDGYADLTITKFNELGYDMTSIHNYDDKLKAIKDTEAFYTGGGNTFYLLNSLYKLNILDAIREKVMSGVPYMGSSAGSNIACPTIKTTNDMPIIFPPSFKSLNLVPFSINAHYLDPDPNSKHNGETRAKRIKEFHLINEEVVVGLREGSWLRIENNVMTLKGLTGAKIFRKNEDAVEHFCPKNLSLLLD